MSKRENRKFRKYRKALLGDKYFKTTKPEVKAARKKAKRENARAAYREVRDSTIEPMSTKAQERAHGTLQRKQRRASRTVHYTVAHGVLIKVK